MRNLNWERIAAASGVLFVALFVIAFFVPGTPPAPGDSRADWIAYTLDKSKELKLSAILFGLAMIAFLWFLGSLAAALRNGGEPRLAAVAFGGGVATISVAFVSTAFQAAMAWRIAADEPTLVRAFADIQYALNTLVSFSVAVFIFATAVASWRARIFPSWYSAGSAVVAVALVFAGGALAYDGFYAPNGAYAIITLIASLVWALATSALLVQHVGVEGAQASAG